MPDTLEFVDLKSTGEQIDEAVVEVARLKSLPWCSGHFQDRSLVAGVNAVLTPVFERGDSSMISGNTIVVPTSGLYLIVASGGRTITYTDLTANLLLNSLTFEYTLELAYGKHTAAGAFATNTALLGLKAGDYIVQIVNSVVAQSTIRNNGATRRFAVYCFSPFDEVGI